MVETDRGWGVAEAGSRDDNLQVAGDHGIGDVVRQRCDPPDELREWAFAVDGNLVAGERHARVEHTAVGQGRDPGGEGVVERDEAALAVIEVAEIAIAHGGGGDRIVAGGALAQFHSLAREEKERAVAAVVELLSVEAKGGEEDRPADGSSELVADQLGGLKLAPVVENVLARARHTEGVVAERLVKRTVNGITAALGSDDDRGRAAVLGRRRAGLDPHLSDGIQALQIRRAAELPVVRRRAILEVSGGVKHQAASAQARAVGFQPRCHIDQKRVQVTAVDRQFGDAARIERAALGGIGGGYQRRGGFHQDGFAHLP